LVITGALIIYAAYTCAFLEYQEFLAAPVYLNLDYIQSLLESNHWLRIEQYVERQVQRKVDKELKLYAALINGTDPMLADLWIYWHKSETDARCDELTAEIMSALEAKRERMQLLSFRLKELLKDFKDYLKDLILSDPILVTFVSPGGLRDFMSILTFFIPTGIVIYLALFPD
jgi:hypothetical protein